MAVEVMALRAVVLRHVRSPEGIWVGIGSGKTPDLTFLPRADVEARMTPAP